jgi:broad specificity phosphatase PhoE
VARLLLLRHGESSWNAEDRWQGWADPPLSEQGEAEAHALAAALPRDSFQGVVSSDLERARRTAAIVAARLGLDVEEDAGLRERDVGTWTGLTKTEIQEGWPDELADWRAGRLESTPEGEPNDSMAARALEVLGRQSDRPEERLLVVTHGGLIRLMERRHGEDAQTTPNLSGRWLHPRPADGPGDGDPFALGPPFAITDLDGAPADHRSGGRPPPFVPDSTATS